jgi:hypothetical protein
MLRTIGFAALTAVLSLALAAGVGAAANTQTTSVNNGGGHSQLW